MITFIAIGDPKPQPRARSFALRGKGGIPMMIGGRPIIRQYDPKTAEGWKAAIADAAKPHIPTEPLKGPIRLDVTFHFRRPKIHYNSKGGLKPASPYWAHSKREDTDNLVKAVKDVLTLLCFWADDRQVCVENTVKLFVKGTIKPGAIVHITPLPDVDITN